MPPSALVRALLQASQEPEEEEGADPDDGQRRSDRVLVIGEERAPLLRGGVGVRRHRKHDQEPDDQEDHEDYAGRGTVLCIAVLVHTTSSFGGQAGPVRTGTPMLAHAPRRAQWRRNTVPAQCGHFQRATASAAACPPQGVFQRLSVRSDARGSTCPWGVLNAGWRRAEPRFRGSLRNLARKGNQQGTLDPEPRIVNAPAVGPSGALQRLLLNREQGAQMGHGLPGSLPRR